MGEVKIPGQYPKQEGKEIHDTLRAFKFKQQRHETSLVDLCYPKR